MSTYLTFAERSKTEMVRQGWDIASWCKRHGVYVTNFYRDHDEVKSGMLVKVADALGVSTDYLLGRTDNKEVM